jgi:ribosomal protein L32
MESIMEVLVINSSPRKAGNSDILCDQFIKGATESGNEVEKINLREQKISPCSSCYACLKTNPAIIDEEIFRAVQRLVRERRKAPKQRELSCDETFRQKIVCADCGTKWRRKVTRSTVYWVCPKHEENINKCSIKQIPEQEIQTAFLRLYYKLKCHREEILTPMLNSLRTIRNRRMLWSVDIIAFLRKKKYEIEDDALELILDITEYYRNRPNFANARTVRNILDQVIMNQNLRTEELHGDNLITIDDVRDYIEEENIDLSRKINVDRHIGFV